MRKDIHLSCVNITRTALKWLKEESSYSTKPVRVTINGVTPGTYTVSAIRLNQKEIYIQEIVSSELRGQVIYRSWNLKKNSEWEVTGIEKLSSPVMYNHIKPECDNFSDRINIILAVEASKGTYFSEALHKSDEILNIQLPSDPVSDKGSTLNRINFLLSRYTPVVISSLIVFGVLVLTLIYSFNIKSFHNTVETSIEEYSTKVDSKVDDFFASTEDEIFTLVDNLEENQKSFEFDRRNAHLNVTRMAEELTRYLPARKEAYKLIAENISTAATYSEIIYELSRLPTEEYQARIFLATNRKSVIPLSRWKAVFSNMLYPVKLKDEGNDGKGFRVTDAYMTERENPFGSGGATPHYAIDIINVSNISYVDNAGEIIRQGNPPGNIVAVYPGTVYEKGFDDRYGYYVTLMHQVTPSVLEKFPEATAWASFYAHMNSETDAKPGDFIKANQELGKIGNTGFSTGPHLHFEIRVYVPDGIFQDDNGRYSKINPFPEQE